MPSGFMYENKPSWEHVYEVIKDHPGIRTGMIQLVLVADGTPLSHKTIENQLTRLRKEGKIRTVSGGRRIRLNYAEEK